MILACMIVSLVGAVVVYFVSRFFTRKKETRRLAAQWGYVLTLVCVLLLSGVPQTIIPKSRGKIVKTSMSIKGEPSRATELRVQKTEEEKRQEKINNAKPMTYEQARQIKEIYSLPTSAKNIYFYYETPFFFTFTKLLRFEAPLKDIEFYVQKIFEDFPAAWEKRPVVQGDISLYKEATWFDTTQIVNGTCYFYDQNKVEGSPTIHQYVCVDCDASVLYWSRGD